MLARCNRYEPDGERAAFIRAAAAFNNVPEDHISPWPGSSDPLNRVAVLFRLLLAFPVLILTNWVGAGVILVLVALWFVVLVYQRLSVEPEPVWPDVLPGGRA